jgi:hypothetical protein
MGFYVGREAGRLFATSYVSMAFWTKTTYSGDRRRDSSLDAYVDLTAHYN